MGCDVENVLGVLASFAEFVLVLGIAFSLQVSLANGS